MVRELGLERRETVRSLSADKYEKLKDLALVREDRGGLINSLKIINNLVSLYATLRLNNY